jgi:hypothetical protein
LPLYCSPDDIMLLVAITKIFGVQHFDSPFVVRPGVAPWPLSYAVILAASVVLFRLTLGADSDGLGIACENLHLVMLKP